MAHEVFGAVLKAAEAGDAVELERLLAIDDAAATDARTDEGETALHVACQNEKEARCLSLIHI